MWRRIKRCNWKLRKIYMIVEHLNVVVGTHHSPRSRHRTALGAALARRLLTWHESHLRSHGAYGRATYVVYRR